MKEYEKLNKHTDEWNAIYPFLEWLYENSMCVGVWRKKEELEDLNEWWLLEHPYPFPQPIANLLYKYFEIDTNKLETERRQLLSQLSK